MIQTLRLITLNLDSGTATMTLGPARSPTNSAFPSQPPQLILSCPSSNAQPSAPLEPTIPTSAGTTQVCSKPVRFARVMMKQAAHIRMCMLHSNDDPRDYLWTLAISFCFGFQHPTAPIYICMQIIHRYAAGGGHSSWLTAHCDDNRCCCQRNRTSGYV